jgi:hypothetical protein
VTEPPPPAAGPCLCPDDLVVAVAFICHVAEAAEPHPGHNILEALALSAPARQGIANAERHLIEHARLAGITWAAIGLALGRTPTGAQQGAQSRYRQLGGRIPALAARIAEEPRRSTDAASAAGAGGAQTTRSPSTGATR